MIKLKIPPLMKAVFVCCLLCLFLSPAIRANPLQQSSGDRFTQPDSILHYATIIERSGKRDSLLFLSNSFNEIYSLDKRKDTLLGWSLYYKALHFRRVNIDSARVYYKAAKKIFDHRSSLLGKLRSTGNWAAEENEIGNFEEAIALYDEAIHFVDSKLNKDRSNKELNILKAKLMVNSSLVYSDLSQFEEAAKRVILARTIARKYDNQDIEMSALSVLGNLHFRTSKWEQAKAYYKEGLVLAEQRGRPNEIAIMKSSIAKSLLKDAHYDSALTFYFETLDLAKKNNQPYAYVRRLTNIGVAYYVWEDYINAEKYMELTLKKADSLGMKDIHLTALQNLGQIYLKNDKIDQGLASAEKAAKISKEIGVKSIEYKSYHALSDLHEELGNFKEAMKWRKKYVSLKDSVINEENLAKIVELETQYETEKKQEEIETLNRRNEIQKLQMKQRNILIAVLAAVFFILFLQGFFLLRQRMLKEKHNTLEARQKLLRSQMSPHFFFNALSSIQTYLWEEETAGKENASEYIESFARLTRLVLENSREEQISLEQEIETIERYLSLQQFRYNHRFDYQILHEENLSLTETLVPPMLLQPLIENIIEDRIRQQQKTRRILLFIEKEDQSICFSLVELANEKELQMRSLNKILDHASPVPLEELFPDQLISSMNDRKSLLTKAYKQEVLFNTYKGIEGALISRFCLPLTVREKQRESLYQA